jgi:HK97 family phage major capsid protein
MPELEQVINSLGTEVHELIEKTKSANVETSERLTAVEQRLSKSTVSGFAGDHEVKSLGELISDNEQYKNFIAGGHARSGRIAIKSFAPYLRSKSTILTTSDTAPLPQRYPIISAGRPALRLRDVMQTLPATSDTVEYIKLKVGGATSNQAQPQGWGSSPAIYEGVVKAQSAMEFEMAAAPIVTVAHWIPASRQILSDNVTLANFVNSQMLYWLRQVEERQLLNGTGASGDLTGLTVGGTAYDASFDKTGDTRIDTLRHVKTQIELAGYSASVAVVNPRDYEAMELTKTSVNTGGVYLIGDPGTPGQVWQLAIVSSKAMTQGDFVVFDGERGAIIYDREQSSIEASREHADYWIRNLVALLCEERITLVIPDSLAVVSGAFPVTSP